MYRPHVSLRKMSEEVGDLHDKISEELWFSDDIIDRHTLYFPATMERIFTREHIGSEDSQLILRNVLCVGLVYYAISEAVSTTTFLREKNTSNSIPSYVLQAFIFIVTEVVGFWNLKHCILNSERWRRLHLRESANYVPVPQGIAYLNLFVYAFRNENYCYMEEFMTWQVSSIGFIYVLSAAIMGLAFKFLPAVFMSAAIFSMVAWRCVVLFAAEASPDYWVRSLSFIMPAFVAFIVNHWAMYVIEYSFRKRFITKKRLEIEMRRLQERHKGVEGILELILPTDVIGRLQASNYNFSAVVDRFETAFSIFIEFISKKELDSMKPEEALRCLNVFFKGLDSILQDFPEVEKIKTISSKALLISCPKGDEEVKRHGDAITKLCFEGD
ncbi:hypothetical protein BC829DRAFT_276875 [Chytridium lagenaria]|nr:hypothetical protein BC829DRAFT_276875 [Chytridium lagenaria]